MCLSVSGMCIRTDVSVRNIVICLDFCFCVRALALAGVRLLEKGESRVCVNGCAYSICV